MKTLYINPENPQQRLIDQVVAALKQGAVIAYPTDTMYGIGCDIYHQKAVKRIFQIKKREKSKPFSFICCSLKNVSKYCFLSNIAYRMMKKCLPGPYTFVLPAMKIVPKIMQTKQKTVGIRVPNNKICQAIVTTLGNPIVTTSAISETDLFIGDAYMVEDRLGNQIDILIDGESVQDPYPYSIISLVSDDPVVLREGQGDISLFQK